jgi:hypothetical protein
MDGVESFLSGCGRSADFLSLRCGPSSSQKASAQGPAITNQTPGPLEGFRKDVSEALNASGYVDVNTGHAQRIQVYLSLRQGSQADGVSQLDGYEALAVGKTSTRQIAEHPTQAINAQARIEPSTAKKLLG